MGWGWLVGSQEQFQWMELCQGQHRDKVNIGYQGFRFMSWCPQVTEAYVPPSMLVCKVGG